MLSTSNLRNLRGVLASPFVRKRAEQLALDLSMIKGSGPGGRIELVDLRPAVSSVAHLPVEQSPTNDPFGPVRREPLSGIEQATARHMAHCWSTIPHVTLFRSVDASRLEAQRQAAKKSFEKIGVKITVTSILVKLVAAALRKHPRVNSSFSESDQQIIYKDYINIGVATDTPRGLLVPVIRDAGRKSLGDVGRELTELADAARQGRLAADQMKGGTFTITNMGIVDVEFFTPIVNHPEVAILGVGATRPVAGNPHELKLPLSLSFDHRVLNGADAARFLQTLAESITDPLVVLLG